MSETKTCFKCGQTMPVDSFYRHSKMADGYLGKCKTCTKRDVREARASNLLAYDERQKRYAKTPRGKEVAARANARYRERNPLKRAAHGAVNDAIKSGALVKQRCEKCGEKAHAHHDDYARPLDVRWLCPRHHADWHLANKGK